MLVRSFVLCFLVANLITAGAENICCLPKVVGPCKAYFPRFFYNKATNQCEQFVYGGCQGNTNNFESLPECLDKCDGVNC
ncbi:hypothetical protein ACROYT_G009837 [Oculina patagonica]